MGCGCKGVKATAGAVMDPAAVGAMEGGALPSGSPPQASSAPPAAVDWMAKIEAWLRSLDPFVLALLAVLVGFSLRKRG